MFYTSEDYSVIFYCSFIHLLIDSYLIFRFVGAFYELTVMFTFYRNIAAYILRDYLPSILTVILSWLSFWIDYRSTPARVSLGITTVLTMVTLLIRTTSGGDSKIIFRSMDIYLFVCNMYVFSATIEYAIVGIIEARRVRRQVEAKNGKDNNNTSNVSFQLYFS